MTSQLSEQTIRQIVEMTTESLGENATVDNVKAVVSQVIDHLSPQPPSAPASSYKPAPEASTEQRRRYYTELLGDWLRSVETRNQPTPAQSIPKTTTAVEPVAPNFIVTVLGKDRPGIIAKVSNVLGDYNCSIMDMSQQILNDYFTVIMVVNLKNCTTEFANLRDQLVQVGNELGVKVLVQHQDVFEYMHRV